MVPMILKATSVQFTERPTKSISTLSDFPCGPIRKGIWSCLSPYTLLTGRLTVSGLVNLVGGISARGRTESVEDQFSILFGRSVSIGGSSSSSWSWILSKNKYNHYLSW
ncbi:hypothetical protein DL546_007350 [Coniochaeta pulveracea]|uniref:Uncharacterized protein n=1 Tax=Coniochaeta pulveracea TaxID=177199 RepID=A0A420YCE0_9PEZI|nr:hypothetical protein DL546_007350 [Coniochaeta pulveracea]